MPSSARDNVGRSARYYSLRAEVKPAAAEPVAFVLHESNATGLEVRDPKTLPMPGVPTPPNGRAWVIGFFAERGAAERARALIRRALPHARCKVASVPHQDWSSSWRSLVRSNQVGRIWVGPPWSRSTSRARVARVFIEPKMAFGTGDHPTTVLCLEAVDEFLRSNPGGSVLDVGTGSGVLAIAAKKLGAGRVVALDTDPICVTAARENCRLNRTLSVQVTASTAEQVRGLFDLVVANILANTLVQMAPLLRARTKKRLVLSGLLVSQRRQLEAAYRRQGFTPLSLRTRGEWLRIDFRPT